MAVRLPLRIASILSLSRYLIAGVMHPILTNALYMIAYGFVAAIIMSLALGLLVKVWNLLTPVDEWEELKKGNIAVAMVLSAVVIGFAIVVATAISPNH